LHFATLGGLEPGHSGAWQGGTARACSAGIMATANFLYGNSTSADLRIHHDAIVASLTTTGEMPEDLADLFVARRVPQELGNPDGSPRFMIFWA
jgi:hypothetical protein